MRGRVKFRPHVGDMSAESNSLLSFEGEAVISLVAPRPGRNLGRIQIAVLTSDCKVRFGQKQFSRPLRRKQETTLAAFRIRNNRRPSRRYIAKSSARFRYARPLWPIFTPLAALHLGGANRIRRHPICAGIQDCPEVDCWQELTRRDTSCYSAPLLAKKPDPKGAVHSISARVRGNRPPAGPAGTLLLDIASAPHGAGARPLEDFDAQLGAHATIVCASISNENPPKSNIDRQNVISNRVAISTGESDVMIEIGWEQRIYPAAKIAIVVDALAAEGVPAPTRCEDLAFAERIAFAGDPGLREPGHRMLSKCPPAVARSALRLPDRPEDAVSSMECTGSPSSAA